MVAIHDAILKAADIGEHSVLSRIHGEEHWVAQKNEDGSPCLDAHGQAVYRPRMVTLRLPYWVDGKQLDRDTEVPISTLVSNRQLVMDELKIRMKVELDGLDDTHCHTDGCSKIRIRTSSSSCFSKKSGNIAELELTFRGAEASEGSVRIDNELIKMLP
jgi:hypothetical protein